MTIGEFFSKFPEINKSQFAEAIGMSRQNLNQYINGKKAPDKTLRKIQFHIKQLSFILNKIIISNLVQ